MTNPLLRPQVRIIDYYDGDGKRRGSIVRQTNGQWHTLVDDFSTKELSDVLARKSNPQEAERALVEFLKEPGEPPAPVRLDPDNTDTSG